MAWLQSLQNNKQRLHALLRSITAFGIRRDPKNPAAFLLSMGSLLKGSWYYGWERLLELWGLRSLHFPAQGRELVITQSANHCLTTGTHRDLHEPHKGYTCAQGITYPPHKCHKYQKFAQMQSCSTHYICVLDLPFGLPVSYTQYREVNPWKYLRSF